MWLAKQLQEIGIDVQLTHGGKELQLDDEITPACREEKSGCYVSSVDLACALHRYCFGGKLQVPRFASPAQRMRFVLSEFKYEIGRLERDFS